MLPLFQNSFLYSKNPSFLSRISTNIIFLGLNCLKNKLKKQFQIFDQTHKLTPMKRNKVCKYILKKSVSLCRKPSFLPKISKKQYTKAYLAQRDGWKTLNLL